MKTVEQSRKLIKFTLQQFNGCSSKNLLRSEKNQGRRRLVLMFGSSLNWSGCCITRLWSSREFFCDMWVGTEISATDCVIERTQKVAETKVRIEKSFRRKCLYLKFCAGHKELIKVQLKTKGIKSLEFVLFSACRDDLLVAKVRLAEYFYALLPFGRYDCRAWSSQVLKLLTMTYVFFSWFTSTLCQDHPASFMTYVFLSTSTFSTRDFATCRLSSFRSKPANQPTLLCISKG
jgi:hypothetical protein